MGLRGPAPAPTEIRKANGNPSKRPLPANEPKYANELPTPPPGMSAAARRVWDRLVKKMAGVGVLCSVDDLALAQLCENEIVVRTLRRDLEALKKAGKKSEGSDENANAMERRRVLSSIREFSALLTVQYREFGISPSSRTRVSGGGRATSDPLEAALCG